MRPGWLASIRSWFARGADADDAEEGAVAADAESDEDSSGIWDVTPSWQYAGPNVESGGLARSEQEAALADVERQAREPEDG